MSENASASPAAAPMSENEETLRVDGFVFKYFPKSWPQAVDGTRRTNFREIVVSSNQILEMRAYYKHRLSLPVTSRVRVIFWGDYFSMDSKKYGSNSNIVRTLAMRKSDRDPLMTPEYIRKLQLLLQDPHPQNSSFPTPVQPDMGREQSVPQRAMDPQPIRTSSRPMSAPVQPDIDREPPVPQRAMEPPMLAAGFGSALLLQLKQGDPYASHPEARDGPYRRNTGYGDSLGDQHRGENIVVSPDKLSDHGLSIFADIPTLLESRSDGSGGRTCLEGLDRAGNSLSVDMATHPHNMILIDMAPFTRRFLQGKWTYQPTVQSHFRTIVERLLADGSVPATPEDMTEPRALFWMFRNLLKKVGVFNNLIMTLTPPSYDPLRSQCTGLSFAEAYRLYVGEFEKKRDGLSGAEGAAAVAEMAELELSFTLYNQYFDERAAAIGVMNWETPELSLESLPPEVRRKRQAALISLTTPLEPLNKEQVTQHPILKGGGRIPLAVQETLREVAADERFYTGAARRTRRMRVASTDRLSGEQTRRQLSHADGLAPGLLSWQNAGMQPTGLGVHLYSGRANRIIMREGKRKRLFDEEMETIKCFGSEQKLLDSMRGNRAEKIATAWTLYCDAVLRREEAADMWDPKILMVPEITMALTSLQTFHFGAEFPVILPMDSETEPLLIPDDLWRVCLHDYHGPNSLDQESTVDIRKDPILCAGCELWKGSDSKFPGF